jgi:hypothetical protein
MAVPSSRVYSIVLTRVSVSAAITLIQLATNASVPAQILRAGIWQSSSTTSTQQPAQLNRKSAAATVTSYTPGKLGPNTDPAASSVGGTAATGTNATAEGTDTTILRQGVFNYLVGFEFVATPKDTMFVDVSSFLGLKLPVAPGAAVTVTADLVFEELG